MLAVVVRGRPLVNSYADISSGYCDPTKQHPYMNILLEAKNLPQRVSQRAYSRNLHRIATKSCLLANANEDQALGRLALAQHRPHGY